MKIVLAGSRRLPSGTAPRALLHFLIRLPTDTQLLIRRAATGVLGPFERDVEVVADILGLHLEYRQPNPAETPGRASVFARDIEMVAEADLILVFLSPEDAESGYSGTYHLFEKALDDQRPVYGWLVYDDGKTDRWGEYDPDNLHGGMIWEGGLP
jgi:hypothetical protein